MKEGKALGRSLCAERCCCWFARREFWVFDSADFFLVFLFFLGDGNELPGDSSALAPLSGGADLRFPFAFPLTFAAAAFSSFSFFLRSRSRSRSSFASAFSRAFLSRSRASQPLHHRPLASCAHCHVCPVRTTQRVSGPRLIIWTRDISSYMDRKELGFSSSSSFASQLSEKAVLARRRLRPFRLL